ncbi:tRNA (guanosine(37)-N1)-methyltransferase TrmD [Coprothermobacteraceae bacterium]|nr:tRNA (guanosine(37)-N1)-methyltransferase TrmD [Coprothermobacteraceae bacterium]
MKRFIIVTLFPETIECWIDTSVVGKARKRGVFDVSFVNPRDFAVDRYKSVDDYMFGGGSGMLLRCDVAMRALDKAKSAAENPLVVALTPSGARFDQEKAKALAEYGGDIVLMCGHYEGIDDRVMDAVDLELSLGDFVLSGGELAAAAVLEATARLLPGFVEKPANIERESFSSGLLEEPQFTRPRECQGKTVPDVLLSGHHQRIEQWKKEQRIRRTLLYRPDLLAAADLDKADKELLKKLLDELDQLRVITGE